MEAVLKEKIVQPRLATLGAYVAKKPKSLDPRKFPEEEFELFSVPSHAEEKPEVVVGKTVGASKQMVEDDTVLLCKINPRINRVWVVSSHTAHRKIASSEWMSFPPNPDFLPQYLGYYLQQDDLRDHLALNASGVGGSLMRAKPGLVKDYPFPLFALPEQRCIVSAIETQLGRLDAAVARLQAAKAKLKRYKQAVLKAAVEGALTEEWREKNAAERNGAHWHAHVLQERKAQLIAAQVAKGKKASSASYKEPIRIDSLNESDTELADLPYGWTWATADEITILITDGEHATPPRSASGVPLLSARNVQDGWLSFEVVDYVTEETHERLCQRLRVKEGDVLLSCSGSVGRCCVAPAESRFSLVRSAAVLRPLFDMGQYLSYAIRSPLVQAQINSQKTQTAQANIFQGKIKQLAIPLPGLEEQKAIVARVDELLSRTEAMEATLDAQLLQSTRLRQAVLKRAFEGRLV